MMNEKDDSGPAIRNSPGCSHRTWTPHLRVGHKGDYFKPRCRHPEGCDPVALDRATLPFTEVEAG